MPGGLIQIVAYGAQDLFLTGIPEITLFKYIYKRYTNFAMEFIELPFNGTKNFGQTISCPIPKNGDLIKDTIIKVELPIVKLEKTTNQALIDSTLSEMTEAENNIINFNNFIQFIYESIYLANAGIDNTNETFTNIHTSITSYLDSNKNFILLKNKVSTDIKQSFDIETDLTTISSKSLNELEKKDLLQILVNSYIERSKNILSDLHTTFSTKKTEYESSLNNNYNFTWIKELGWNLINNIELQVGGVIIDRQYNYWLYIWNEFFESSLKKLDYIKLFNLNSESYTFNNKSKDAFTMYIPLKFFFNRHDGLSFPLISVRYQEILFKLKIEELTKLIYTDYTSDDIKDLIKLNTITLLVNYIYLDQDERTKFAQANHEYLIEQVNYFEFSKLKSSNLNLELNLNHPTKYYIWSVQKKSDIVNYNLHNYYSSDLIYTISDNYPTISTSENNTIASAQLELNGVDRTSLFEGEYYNYVTSYEMNLNTPADGLNFYSFAINPKDIQPSGSCNFSRLNRKVLKMNLSATFLNRLTDTDYMIIKFSSINYNILKFNKGSAKLVFAY